MSTDDTNAELEQYREEKTLWRLPDCPRCDTPMESFRGSDGYVDQCPECGWSP